VSTEYRNMKSEREGGVYLFLWLRRKKTFYDIRERLAIAQ
jgi:hypothetical protein